MPGNNIGGLMDRMIDPSQNQPIESPKTVSKGLSFTETAKQLHTLFAKEGSSGAIRLKDGEFHVKGKFGLSSELWDKHVGSEDQLKIRHDKFHNAAQELSDAIDREYGDLMVGDKKMSEYVLGDFLQSDGIHRLTEADLTTLENKVLTGLNIAYDTAVSKGDSATMDLLSDRVRVLGAAEFQPESSQDAQSSSGWRRRVVEYRLLRDAVASELRNMPDHAQQAEQSGANPDRLSEGLLEQADSILLETGTLHLGLTKRSVDKVLTYLQNNTELAPNSEKADTSRFSAVASLHDKVTMNENIAATTANLKGYFEKVENTVHTQMENRDYLGTKPEEMLNSLTEMKGLIETLESSVMQGTINDPKVAQDLANRINESALRLSNAHEPEDIGTYWDDEYYEPENLRNRIIDVSSPISGVQLFARAFAKNVADVSDDVGMAPEAADLPASEAASTASEAMAPLRQEMLFEFFGDGAPMSIRLEKSDFIYRNNADQNDGVLSASTEDMETYHQQLDNVRKAFDSCLAEDTLENVENLRSALKETTSMSGRLMLHQVKYGPEKFGGRDGTLDLLKEQSTGLVSLSIAAEQARGNFLNSEAPAQGVVLDDQYPESSIDSRSIPQDLPDLPENSVSGMGGDIVPPNDSNGIGGDFSLQGDAANASGLPPRPRSDSEVSDVDDVFGPPEDDVEDVFGPPPPGTTATPGFGTPGEAITPGGNGAFETVMSPQELAMNGLGAGDLESKYGTVEEAADALYNEVEDRSDLLDELLEDEMAFAENPDLKGQLERGNKELSSLLGKLTALREKKEPEAWQEANALQNEFDTISERMLNGATTEVSQKLGLVDSNDLSDDLTSDDNSVIAGLEVRDGNSTTAGGPQSASESQGGDSTSDLDDHVAQQRQMHHRQSLA